MKGYSRRRLVMVFGLAALLAALVVERRTHEQSRTPCWGDTVPVFEEVSRKEIAAMRLVATSGPPSTHGDTGVIPIGKGEIRCAVESYKGQVTGWTHPIYMDPTSCNRRVFELDHTYTTDYASSLIVHARDDARDIDAIVVSAEPLLLFRRRAAKEPRFWMDPDHRKGELAAGIAALLLAFGVIVAMRGRPRAFYALTFISMATALSAVLFFVAA